MGFFYYRENNNKIIEYLIIMLGTAFMAISTMWYFDAIGIVTGGVTGIGIILRNMFGIPIWVVNLLANIPLFAWGSRALGRNVLKKSLFGTVSLTIILGVLPGVDVLTGDKLVDVIYGSAFMGIGLGLIFRCYASSGGADLLATIINRRVRYISIPKILALVDGVIVLLGIGVFGLKNGVYSLICVFIISKVSDVVVEGPNRAKIMYIISDEYDKHASYIKNVIGRGVTYIDTTGAYTGKRRSMIMCVVSTKEMAKIKQNIYANDSKAICFVGDIREAYGEGFTKLNG